MKKYKTTDFISPDAFVRQDPEDVDPCDADLFLPTDELVKTFVGYNVVPYDPDSGPITSDQIYRVDSDDSDLDAFKARLDAFLDNEGVAKTPALVVGYWGYSGFEQEYDIPAEGAVKLLVERSERLPNLSALFFGDINEMGISQYLQTDISPLLNAFPHLEMLRVRGGIGLQLSQASHAKLRGLAIESSGLTGELVRSVVEGDFPELEHLELWLGSKEHRGTSTVQDLDALFQGDRFPHLKYLGLRNCDYTDDIAKAIVQSPLVKRLETLDLSLGVFSDAGAEALLALPTDGSLKKISIHHHLVEPPLVDQLNALPFEVDTSLCMSEAFDRYVAVGE